MITLSACISVWLIKKKKKKKSRASKNPISVNTLSKNYFNIFMILPSLFFS